MATRAPRRAPPGGAPTAGGGVAPAYLVATAVLAAAGLALRLYAVLTPRGFLDGDEAIVGLMARGWRSGDVRTFFWDQPYGGSLESLLVSATAAVTGWGLAPLRTTSIVLNAGTAVVVWRLARRVLAPGPAVLAAGLTWCAAGTFVWWSIKSRGFYQLTLLLGVALALVLVQCVQDGFASWRVAGAGLLAGLGWWQSPHIAYVALPLGLWALAVSVADGAAAVVRRGLVAGGASVLGAAPWLVFNLRNDWVSLHPPNEDVTFVTSLGKFVRVGLSSLFGLALGDPTRYVHGAVGDRVLTAGLAALLVWGIVRLWPPGLRSPRVGVVAPLLAYPFLTALLPNGAYVGEGRYLSYAVPFAAIALAALLTRPAAALAAAAVAVVLAASYVVWLDPISATTTGTRLPADTQPVLDELAALGDPPAMADYWLAYRLRYLGDDRFPVASTTFVRDLEAQGEVYARPTAAWVFPAGDPVDAQLRCALDHRGLASERREAGGYVVVLPARLVPPGDVFGCA